jgi:prevent-host-death family protein
MEAETVRVMGESRERVASATEVRQRFGAAQKAIREGETIVITKYGEPVAAFLPPAEYARLVALSEQARLAGVDEPAGK